MFKLAKHSYASFLSLVQNGNDVIPPISAKRTTISHLHSLNCKKDRGNRGHGLEQAHNCSGVKLVNWTPILPIGNKICNNKRQKLRKVASIPKHYMPSQKSLVIYDKHKHGLYNSKINECL